MNINKNALKIVGVFTGGLAVGSVTTYFLTRRAFRQLADAEIENVKEHYRLIREKENLIPLDDALRMTKYVQTSEDPENPVLTEEDENGEPVESVEDTVERGRVLVQNVFSQTTIELTEDEEAAAVPAQFTPKRSATEPYVISADEFMDDIEEEGVEYERVSLTYFEDDNTLIDERESIVTDVETTVGFANLGKFGVGTTDKHMVHIRNDFRRILFEVARDERSYTEVVQGISPEQMEAISNRHVRMRPGDD